MFTCKNNSKHNINNSLCFNFSLQKVAIAGLNPIWGYIILYVARGVLTAPRNFQNLLIEPIEDTLIEEGRKSPTSLTELKNIPTFEKGRHK